MKSVAQFFSELSNSGSVQQTLSKIEDFAGLQSIAQENGFSITKSDLIEFIRCQQNSIAAGNVAGVDGSGSMVFGRDWFYPEPDLEARSIL